MLINGCQEGKVTPRLSEVKCPKCGAWVEIFVIMGGAIGKTGTLAGDETCSCGNVYLPVATNRIMSNEEKVRCSICNAPFCFDVGQPAKRGSNDLCSMLEYKFLYLGMEAKYNIFFLRRN